MNSKIRTDLAQEAHQLWRESAGETTELRGVLSREEQKGPFKVSTVEILDEEGEKALGKPRGKYVCVQLDGYIRREENAFEEACKLIGEQLGSMLKMENNENCLVVGLGNRDITPDAVGPDALDCVMVTRHLKERMPQEFAAFRPVSAVCSGVLGTTGIESGDLIASVCEKIKPAAVIAIDALAARETDKLCRTVQIADTGIVPGSGVGNARKALSRETLGVPVIAVGVPTVVDAATLAHDLAARSGANIEPEMLGAGDMFVTPRDIDRSVRDISKLIGYSINLALHDGLTIADVDMFVS